MGKTNFKRTNVDVQQMEVSAPSRSSFDLTLRGKYSIGLGRLIPLRSVDIMPNSTFKGSVNPELQMEKFATPSAGPMRLDTHTFIVPARRINNQYKLFTESAINGNPMSLPSFTLGDVTLNALHLYFGKNGDEYPATIGELVNMVATAQSGYDPFNVLKACITKARTVIESHVRSTTAHFGYMQDWLAIESARLKALEEAHSSASFTSYLLGDMLYDVLVSICGEGSILDNLGYDIFSYFSDARTNLNTADEYARAAAHTTTTAWTQTEFNNYCSKLAASLGEVCSSRWFVGSPSHLKKYFINPAQSEMPLRAAYACWYDWFRNYHVEKYGSVLNPDDFNNSPLISGSASLIIFVQLLVPRSRNWSRDMFTMVQPDDVYRHVYAPGMSDTQATHIYETENGSSTFEAAFKTLYTQLYNSPYNLDLPFPSSFFSGHPGATSNSVEVLYHDLQTMRRANMLEAYLRKNYFNSDTFAGQIEAHYGVKPSDFAILVSQYLGGSESMINGEQTISPSTTQGSDAGERTLVANAKSSDSFSYMCSDASYLINFASIVPIVSYDARNPFLSQLGIMDQPIPEFSNDPRVIIRTCDLVRGFNDKQNDMLGYVPRYYAYRHALDGVHGKYLREYRSYDWIRDRYSSGPLGYYLVGSSDNNMVSINAYSQHINIAPDCFLGLQPWDSVAFGKIDMPLFVECPLAGKVEFI